VIHTKKFPFSVQSFRTDFSKLRGRSILKSEEAAFTVIYGSDRRLRYNVRN